MRAISSKPSPQHACTCDQSIWGCAKMYVGTWDAQTGPHNPAGKVYGYSRQKFHSYFLLAVHSSILTQELQLSPWDHIEEDCWLVTLLVKNIGTTDCWKLWCFEPVFKLKQWLWLLDCTAFQVVCILLWCYIQNILEHTFHFFSYFSSTQFLVVWFVKRGNGGWKAVRWSCV